MMEKINTNCREKCICMNCTKCNVNLCLGSACGCPLSTSDMTWKNLGGYRDYIISCGLFKEDWIKILKYGKRDNTED